MKYCTYCGEKNEDNAAFCVSCGKKLGTCACHCERFVNNANDLNSIDILTDISYWS